MPFSPQNSELMVRTRTEVRALTRSRHYRMAQTVVWIVENYLDIDRCVLIYDGDTIAFITTVNRKAVFCGILEHKSRSIAKGVLHILDKSANRLRTVDIAEDAVACIVVVNISALNGSCGPVCAVVCQMK